MGGFEGVVALLVVLLSYLAPASLGLAIGNAIEKYSGASIIQPKFTCETWSENQGKFTNIFIKGTVK
jgi:hypothetical protein